ncbi:MAG: ABC transporter ATP-binding protein [Rhodobiaceae bacterium]|nr:ABC transporter ATP-binding protein [Rhodobiaceae bacterium]MCC0055149.1 ABC transporter ATP-binding protein [Rhodobiaceae bacterium]
MASTFDCRNVTVTRGARHLLADLSLTIAPGLTGLVGPNGAGKTTLLRVLAGLEDPAAGTVAFDGAPLAAMSMQTRARKLAYLAQEAAIHWPMPAREVVALGRLPFADSQSAAGRAACEEAMRLTGTTHLADQIADSLSGGERARILLARAIAVGAPVLLADEPTAALDLKYRLETFSLLRRLADDGQTIVAAFHDLAFAERFADRVIVLSGGLLAGEGMPDSTLTDDLISRVFEVSAGPAGRFGPRWEPA